MNSGKRIKNMGEISYTELRNIIDKSDGQFREWTLEFYDNEYAYFCSNVCVEMYKMKIKD